MFGSGFSQLRVSSIRRIAGNWSWPRTGLQVPVIAQQEEEQGTWLSGCVGTRRRRDENA